MSLEHRRAVIAGMDWRAEGTELLPGRTCDMVKPCSFSELTTSAQDRWVQGARTAQNFWSQS